MPPKPDEPRTETTLTTRIRINIPGSRPIPPVIMRTPVGDEAAQADGATGAPAAAGPAGGAGGAAVGERKPVLPRRPEPSAAPAHPEAERQGERSEGKEKTSDWFAPRKGGGAASAPGSAASANRRPGLSGGGVGGASGGFGGGSASGGAPGLGGPRQGGSAPAPGPQNPSTTAATPWPADPMATGANPILQATQQDPMATGANPILQGPPPVAAPVDDWPMDPSTTSATPWQSGGPQAPAVPADDWPGGSSTTSATPWPGEGQGTGAAPADDWPGASPAAPGNTPWQGGNAAAARAARRSGSQTDDWPGGSSTTGVVPQPGLGDSSATGTMPQPGFADSSVAGTVPQADDWPGGSSTTGGMPQPGLGDSSATGVMPQADDWPGGSSVTGAVQQPGFADSSVAGTVPQVDDWPGGSSTTGAMPQPPVPGGAVGGAAPWPGDAMGAGAQGGMGAPGVPGGMAGQGVPGGMGVPGGQGGTRVPGVPGGQGAPGVMGAPGAQGGGVPGVMGARAATGANPVVPPPAPSPDGNGAAPWNGAVESTQQFPAPTMGQGAAPFAPAAPGGAAFAERRTDTPREGFPRVPAPPTGAQSAQQAPAGAQAPKQQQNKGGGKGAKGGKKGGGPKVPAPAGRTAAGETLVSGVPVVPPPGGPAKNGPVDSGAPRVAVPKPKVPAPGAKSAVPAPAAPAAKSAPAKSAPKKKGRSKLVLLGGALVGLVGVAYGAGLLLDHADVPNGTTVLGVAIGGSSKEQAVQKLDSALGDRATAPLKVSIGGKEAQLKPAVAGLTIDTQATVREAAGRDYNPLTVIGSLVGGTRTAEPSIGADEEKIADALKRASGETGSAKEGTIKFEPGKAVPVYGQPYQGLDTDKAVAAVAQAYRDRAATGQDRTVELPSAEQQPKVDKAEVDRVMESFAKPAMSGLVTVQTDPAHKIQFGPEHSLPKILSVSEVNGKLVDHYDLEAVKELCGSAFTGVKIQRGDGSKTDVTPQDVVGALRKALMGKTPAERVGVIQVNGN
ncbi:hypothetical protein [Streptomyces sp. NPDC002537]